MTDIHFHTRADGVRLAYRHTPKVGGTGPVLVFLPGYASDMEGGKATALFEWAAARSHECLLLDYSGCGASEGAFEDGTLDIWRDDVLTLIDALIDGPIILIGSSMGGWIMLLTALARADKIAGLIGIAAAPDFTQWGFTEAKKQVIAETGRWEEPSSYDDTVMVTTREFWESGQANLLLSGPIHLDCPVRLIHGQRDDAVPWELSLQIAAALRSSDVQVSLVKAGDHRLSRDEDIALLIATADKLLSELS